MNVALMWSTGDKNTDSYTLNIGSDIVLGKRYGVLGFNIIISKNSKS